MLCPLKADEKPNITVAWILTARVYLCLNLVVPQIRICPPLPVRTGGVGVGYKSPFVGALGLFCSLFNWCPLSIFGVTCKYPGMMDCSRDFLIRGTTTFGVICSLSCSGLWGFFGQSLYQASPGALINHLNEFCFHFNITLQFQVLGDCMGCSLYTWFVLRLYSK